MNRSYRYFENISSKTSLFNFFRSILRRFPGFEKWLTNRTSGKHVNSIWAKLVPPEYVYAKNSIRHIERDGVKYKLDISDTVDHFIFFGFADRAFNNLISFVKEDSIIIDVGANVGRFSLVFASVAKHGRIISYEPDPLTFARLLDNIAYNGFNNVVPINKALGQGSGTQNLFRVNPHNSGMNRITSTEVLTNQDTVAIEVCAFDDEAANFDLSGLDLIKIDVEGFEYKTLVGMEETIKRFRPILFIEIVHENLRDNDDSPELIVSWLVDRNYKVLQASNMDTINKQTILSNCHFDAICFPVIPASL